jgi:hypothetical protein
MSAPLPDRLRLDIAGLPIVLQWADGFEPVTVPAAYRPFLAEGWGGLPLALSPAPTGDGPGRMTFDNTPIWSLHRAENRNRFEIFPGYPDLRRSLEVDGGLEQARLTFLAADRDPFVGPAFELITILRLARQRGLILHGCGIALDGRGTAFIGVSGAGKSTLSRLWATVDGVRILSDDRVIVRGGPEGFRLYGSPWHGDACFAAPGSVPLDRIVFIRHGENDRLTPMRPAASVRELLCCAFPPFWDPAGVDAALAVLHDLATAVPCDELYFRPTPAVIDFIRAAA